MKTWTMRQALFCLIGSTIFTLTMSLTCYWLWSHYRHQRLIDEKYRCVAIVTTGPEKEPLKTAYLAELLGLSADHPTPLYAINTKKAEAKLLSSPLIANAKVKRMPPGTLYIDYEVRKPLARLADYKNTALDKEGYLFPAAPFFSPKHLPEVYLGLPPFTTWQISPKNPYLQLALEILSFLDTAPWKEGIRIKRIDVSNAFAPTLGTREIVLFTEEELVLPQEVVCVFPKILRLAPKDYPQQLNNFFALRRTMMDDYRRQLASLKQGGRFAPRIVDLRIPQLAFVEKG
ncbi:MAG TPA: FtsQ-type POTRA domain-containing protein [Chlamydiales bacterium]|nr:FtsQ-type POTRA domain-containing protein [Chlamydiales bacterium]